MTDRTTVTLILISVLAFGLTQIVLTLAVLRTLRVSVVIAPVVEDPEPRRPQPVFIPLGCGIATAYGRLTEPCARGRNHAGRCMTELEIQRVADHGMTANANLVVDAVALARHVNAMPTALMERELTDAEIVWLARVRSGVLTMAGQGDPLSEWGETNETKLISP